MPTSSATVKRLGGKRTLAFTTNLREFALFLPTKKSTDAFLRDASGSLDYPIILVSIERRSPSKSMIALFHEFHHCLDIFEDPASLYRIQKHTGWNSPLETSINKKAKKDLEEYAKSL
jgi:hypothetical protein